MKFQGLIVGNMNPYNGGEACLTLEKNWKQMEPIVEKALEREDQVVLSLLEEIEKNPHTSQRQLANKVGVAVGLVNAFLKRVISKGYVKASRISSRNVHYLLTPHGILEKSRLTYKYLRHSLRFVWLYRQKVRELLEPYANGENKKVVIYGSGEEAELAYLAICELGMELEAIVDPERVGEKCVGIEIRHNSWFTSQKSVNILLVLHSIQLRVNYIELFEQLESMVDKINNFKRIEL